MKVPLFALAISLTVVTVSGWWTAAVDAYAKADAYYPATYTIRIEEYNNDNKLLSVETGTVLQRWTGTAMETTVLRAEKNSKDITKDWQKRFDKQNGGNRPSDTNNSGGPPEGFDISPFEKKYYADLVIDTARMTVVDGKIAVPYSVNNKKSKAEGTAYFTAEGVPLGAVQTYNKLPPLVESLTAEFSYLAFDDALVMKSFTMNTLVNAVIAVKRYKVSMVFDQWKKK